MIECDYISKSMLSKAKKREQYELAYTARDKALAQWNAKTGKD